MRRESGATSRLGGNLTLNDRNHNEGRSWEFSFPGGEDAPTAAPSKRWLPREVFERRRSKEDSNFNAEPLIIQFLCRDKLLRARMAYPLSPVIKRMPPPNLR